MEARVGSHMKVLWCVYSAHWWIIRSLQVPRHNFGEKYCYIYGRSDLYFFSVSTTLKSISTGPCSNHWQGYQSASHSFLLTPPSALPGEYIWEHARRPQQPVGSVWL